MRKPFIGGNWKMHGTKAEIDRLITELNNALEDFTHADVVVFPSFIYLPFVSELLKERTINLGAQDCNEHESGAFTGEISPAMLVDAGCRYVIVGHSERRHIFKESNETVAEKLVAALKQPLIPVLCVGETQEEREAGKTETVILEQLKAVVELAGLESLEKSVIAYEPVWAIGTGLTATPEQAQAVHQWIREWIAKADANIAEIVRIIYGGSVKAANAEALFSQTDIDGGLVGGASLKSEAFSAICKAINK